MNRKLLAVICLILLVMAVVLPGGGRPQAALAPSYSISQYDIQFFLRSDGTAEVVETISCQVLRDLKEFHYEIAYRDSGSINLTKISTATQAATGASPVFIEVQPDNTASNQNRPMTYEIKDDGQHLQIQLNVFSEEGSVRVVRMAYQLSQTIRRHRDAALLERRFFGSGGAVAVGRAQLTIQLPQVTASLETWSLPVSLVDFVASQPYSDQLSFQAEKIPAGQDMLLICLLPPVLFPLFASVPQSLNWEELTDSAKKLDQELHDRADLRSSIAAFLIIMLSLAVLSGLLIYRFFDHESATLFRQRYLREMPPDLPPAMLAVFLRRTRPGPLILGTLLDLVRRGELALNGCVFSQLHPERREFPGLAAFEVFMLHWLFGRITPEKTLSIADIRRFARDPATAPDFQSDYSQFRRLLDEEISSRSLIDARQTRQGQLASRLAALFYLVLAVFSGFYWQTSGSLLLLIPAAGLATYSMQIRHLNVAGRELHARCRAWQRTIRDFGRPLDQLADFPLAVLLPLSLCLGSGGRLLRTLLKKDRNQLLQFAGQLAAAGYMPPAKSGPDQVKALAADLKVMESMLAASLLLASGVHG